MSKKSSRKTLHISLIFAVLFLSAALVFFIDTARTSDFSYTFPFIGMGGVFKYHAVTLFGTRISLYWLMHGVGIVGMMLLCLARRKRFRISAGLAVITALLLAVFGYIGAKLLYIIENWNLVIKNGVSLNGVSFFGTVFFMPLILPLFAKLFHKSPSSYLDYCTPAGLLMLICIRTGCFFNGCCQGLSLTVHGNPTVLPAQLLECALDLVLLDFILFNEKSLPKGKLYFLFMGGYGLLRFVVEFIRDTPKTMLGLSNGQWFSLIAIFLAAAAWLFQSKKGRS